MILRHRIFVAGSHGIYGGNFIEVRYIEVDVEPLRPIYPFAIPASSTIKGEPHVK